MVLVQRAAPSSKKRPVPEVTTRSAFVEMT